MDANPGALMFHGGGGAAGAEAGVTPYQVEQAHGVWRTDDIGGGQVLVARTGISAAHVAGRFAYGETIDAIASDYDVSPRQIENAIRAIVRGAFTRRGLAVAVARRMEEAVPLLRGAEWRQEAKQP